MKRSRFTDSQITAVLKQIEDGIPPTHHFEFICANLYRTRHHPISSRIFRLIERFIGASN